MNLTEAVKAAGVVGAGGAGFPTHVKLSAKAEAKDCAKEHGIRLVQE